MNLRQLLRAGFGLGCAIFFIGLITQQISWAQLSHAFVGTQPGYLILAFFVFMVGYACRIERWRLMLIRNNPNLKWRQCAGPFLGSFATNNVLPFRAGDVLRAVAFNRELGVSTGGVVATLFVERLLDLLLLLLLLGVALSLFSLNVSRFIGLGSGALIGLAGAILLLLLAPQMLAPIFVFLGRLFMRLAPRLGERVLTEIHQSLATLILLSRGRTMLKLIAWSLAAWLSEGCVFWMTALSLPSISAPVAGWLALPVGTFATLIPSTPGYVGTFDYFTAYAMAAIGNETGASTAYALLVHAVLWLPPTVAGGIYLLVRQMSKLKTQ